MALRKLCELGERLFLNDTQFRKTESKEVVHKILWFLFVSGDCMSHNVNPDPAARACKIAVVVDGMAML